MKKNSEIRPYSYGGYRSSSLSARLLRIWGTGLITSTVVLTFLTTSCGKFSASSFSGVSGTNTRSTAPVSSDLQAALNNINLKAIRATIPTTLKKSYSDILNEALGSLSDQPIEAEGKEFVNIKTHIEALRPYVNAVSARYGTPGNLFTSLGVDPYANLSEAQIKTVMVESLTLLSSEQFRKELKIVDSAAFGRATSAIVGQNYATNWHSNKTEEGLAPNKPGLELLAEDQQSADSNCDKAIKTRDLGAKGTLGSVIFGPIACVVFPPVGCPIAASLIIGFGGTAVGGIAKAQKCDKEEVFVNPEQVYQKQASENANPPASTEEKH